MRIPNLKQMAKETWQRYRLVFEAPSDATNPSLQHQFDYFRMWKAAMLWVGGVTLLPLVFITVIDYQVTQRAILSELSFRTSRMVSNTRRSIEFFIEERRSALAFIVKDNPPAVLKDPRRLERILENLRQSFGGGFMDLGVVTAAGRQEAYVGPYALSGVDYSGEPWFKEVVERGVYISDVFLGYRKDPHMVIAIKGEADGAFYVLRASLGIQPFVDVLSDLELSGHGEAFLVSPEGILQTPSHSYGALLEKISLPVPKPSTETRVQNIHINGELLLIGYRYFEKAPFILMIVKKHRDLMAPWYRTRLQLIAFLLVSVTIILVVILWVVTRMVAKIHDLDHRRLAALHHVEYSNKLATIGRMAAGVAHEINNPLAIIGEKAGLIKDFFTIKKAYAEDPKLIAQVDAITQSVHRAGKITKRLLSFARNLDARKETVDLRELIDEVLGFLGKEAQHRGIRIEIDTRGDIAPIEQDRGKLQQIFLNIVNNAMAALQDNGRLEIRVRPAETGFLNVDFIDNGCGISKEDQRRIFEPFFTTKSRNGGTGLGLSITYNLTREIGGRIDVESEPGKGTRFTVIVPTQMPDWEGGRNACTAGG